MTQRNFLPRVFLGFGASLEVEAWFLELLTPPHLHTQNLTRLAHSQHFKRPATDFAIGREPLRGHARINSQFKTLAAIGALHGFRFFHHDRDSDCRHKS